MLKYLARLILNEELQTIHQQVFNERNTSQKYEDTILDLKNEVSDLITQKQKLKNEVELFKKSHKVLTRKWSLTPLSNSSSFRLRVKIGKKEFAVITKNNSDTSYKHACNEMVKKLEEYIDESNKK